MYLLQVYQHVLAVLQKPDVQQGRSTGAGVLVCTSICTSDQTSLYLLLQQSAKMYSRSGAASVFRLVQVDVLVQFSSFSMYRQAGVALARSCSGVHLYSPCTPARPPRPPACTCDAVPAPAPAPGTPPARPPASPVLSALVSHHSSSCTAKDRHNQATVQQKCSCTGIRCTVRVLYSGMQIRHQRVHVRERCTVPTMQKADCTKRCT